MSNESTPQRERISTGVAGLDEILGGGLPDQRIYLVEGGPGTGKTTLGLQFLLEGARLGQRVMLISLLQTRDELHDVGASHHWQLDPITFLELPEDIQDFTKTEQTVFTLAEIELTEVTDAMVHAIAEHKPQRLVIDSLSEMQTIVEGQYQLRRQLVRLKHALFARDVNCTTLLTAGLNVSASQPTIETIVHGSILLTQDSKGYGQPRRRIEVNKVRGIDFAGGSHDCVIRTGGLAVYPRLYARAEERGDQQRVFSNNQALDTMLGGGLDTGSTCLVLGTSGAGKSTLCSIYADAVARGGGRVSAYCFEESRATFLRRSRGLKLGITEHVERGRVELRDYAVGDLPTGQLMDDLREDVEQRQTRLVILDSYTGYLNLLSKEDRYVTKLHELFAYLSAHGVLTMVTFNLHGLFGKLEKDIDTSYLADTVVMMRHFEAMGSVRQCISVLKKRHGAHERRIREYEVVEGGMRLGPPLTDFSGVLSGTPTYHGDSERLLDRRPDNEDGG